MELGAQEPCGVYVVENNRVAFFLNKAMWYGFLGNPVWYGCWDLSP